VTPRPSVSSSADEPKENEQQLKMEKIINLICRLAIVSFVILVLANHVVSLLAALYHIPQDVPASWHIYAWFNTTYIVLTLREAGVLAYFLFIVFCIFASFFWVTRKEGKEAVHALKKENLLAPTQNSFILLFQLLFVYFFFFAVYWQVMAWVGVDFTLYPHSDYAIPTRGIFSLTNAPVYEEIFFRMVLIGVPLFIIALLMFFAGHRKKIPSPHRFLLGGGANFGAYAVIFLVISSFYFAYAHVRLSIQEPSIALLPPMLVAGLILGYLFLEKGIHVAMIFHFIVNYMFMLTYMNNAGLVIEPAGIVFEGVSTAAFYLLHIFGAVAGSFYFLYFSKKTLLFLKAGAEEAGLLKGLREQ
jgi:hypothetical protein